jgi:transcriptional regulator with XRE-family HTH domain
MTDIQSVLARNMKILRAKAGLTQENLAEKSGLTPSYIGAVEIGKRYPKPDTLERIAEALGVDTPELFTARAIQILPVSNVSLENLKQAIIQGITGVVETKIDKLKV